MTCKLCRLRSGLSEEAKQAIVRLPADRGAVGGVDERCGVAVVGAVPWVQNFNLLLTDKELTEEELLAKARRIAGNPRRSMSPSTIQVI